jgi:hypothetical protein
MLRTVVFTEYKTYVTHHENLGKDNRQRLSKGEARFYFMPVRSTTDAIAVP